jgi:hypothetical protein
MNDAGSPPAAKVARRYVLFYEALWWIACRNLAGWSVGPLPLAELLNYEEEIADDAQARRQFAIELLLDAASRGKVRIHTSYIGGRVFDPPDRPTTDNLVGPDRQLEPTFIKRASFVEEEGKPTLYLPEEEGSYYTDLAVDFDDLVDQFWGEDAGASPAKPPMAEPTPESGREPSRAASRRGRPRKYPWHDFSGRLPDDAETVRFARLISNARCSNGVPTTGGWNRPPRMSARQSRRCSRYFRPLRPRLASPKIQSWTADLIFGESPGFFGERHPIFRPTALFECE